MTKSRTFEYAEVTVRLDVPGKDEMIDSTVVVHAQDVKSAEPAQFAEMVRMLADLEHKGCQVVSHEVTDWFEETSTQAWPIVRFDRVYIKNDHVLFILDVEEYKAYV